MDNNNYLKIMILLLCLALAGCTADKKVEYSSEDDIMAEKYIDNKSSNEGVGNELADEIMVVYVCGAVSCPGVYEIDVNGRISDAVAAAGGFVAEADKEKVNLAAIVEDGSQIRIPFIGEDESVSENLDEASISGGASGKININKAAKEQLMTLSGVGESKADAIIKYRDTNGPFRTVEDIMNIEGIKEGVFNKIKDDICVK